MRQKISWDGRTDRQKDGQR